MRKLLAVIIYIAYRAIGLTYRFVDVDSDNREAARAQGTHGKYVVALWHQNLFAMIQRVLKEPCVTMASRSKDGELIAWSLRRLGWHPTRGSSSRGGRQALDEMLEVLADPNHPMPAALTVDGPRGPAHEVKNGVIDLAQRAGVPVVPFAAHADRYWQLRSWDRFRIPKPFARIVVHWGPPIFVPANLDANAYESYRDAVKREMDRCEARGLAYFETTQGAVANGSSG